MATLRVYDNDSLQPIDNETVDYLAHKASKNKWKSKQIGKRCRNRQRQSKKGKNKRRRRAADEEHAAHSGGASAHGRKNLKQKRRLCNDAIITESILNDIFDAEQCDLEQVLDDALSGPNPTVTLDFALLVLASPKRRRRRSHRGAKKGLGSPSLSSVGDDASSVSGLSDNVSDIGTVFGSASGNGTGDAGAVTTSTSAKEKESEKEKEVCASSFDVAKEMRMLKLSAAATLATELKALEEKYQKQISRIKELNEYAPIGGLAQRSSFKEYDRQDESTAMDPKTMKKVFKEIRTELPKNLVVQWHGSMFVRFDEDNPRFLQALLTGLEDTPYENGLFLFDLYLHKDYPNSPLKIKHVTKGGALVYGSHTPGGFSPNLHRDSGKVCLSLLGTWGANQWDPKTSNIYQVLSSILFWIFGARWAYYMEPSYGGWELTAPMAEEDPAKHKDEVVEYNYEVIEKCMKYAMLETMRAPYQGFEEIVRAHFKVKREVILRNILQNWIKKAPNTQRKDKLITLYLDIKEELNKM